MCSLHHESVKMRHLIFIYLFLLGGLVCVCDSVLNNALLGSLLWGIPVVTAYLAVLLFPVHSLLFAGHQGSSQSDPCTNTGFGSFKLPTCG